MLGPKLRRRGHFACQSRGFGPSLTCLEPGLWWWKDRFNWDCWLEHLYMAFPYGFSQHWQLGPEREHLQKGPLENKCSKRTRWKLHGFYWPNMGSSCILLVTSETRRPGLIQEVGHRPHLLMGGVSKFCRHACKPPHLLYADDCQINISSLVLSLQI